LVHPPEIREFLPKVLPLFPVSLLRYLLSITFSVTLAATTQMDMGHDDVIAISVFMAVHSSFWTARCSTCWSLLFLQFTILEAHQHLLTSGQQIRGEVIVNLWVCGQCPRERWGTLPTKDKVVPVLN
jgi:hypothetical protein